MPRPPMLLTVNGESLTIAQWATRATVRESNIRKRMRAGLPPEECILPVRDSRRRTPYRWRTESIRRRVAHEARHVAFLSGRKPPLDAWDLPLEEDPWGQAAIESAATDGPLTLDEVGILLGVSRERVRQIEEIALRKLRRIEETGMRASGIVDMLRDVCAIRDYREDGEYE